MVSCTAHLADTSAIADRAIADEWAPLTRSRTRRIMTGVSPIHPHLTY